MAPKGPLVTMVENANGICIWVKNTLVYVFAEQNKWMFGFWYVKIQNGLKTSTSNFLGHVLTIENYC